MGLQITKQKNKKYTVEFTGFSNRTGQQERFYCIENVTEELLEKFMDRAGIHETDLEYSMWHLRYLNVPARFDEFGRLKGVVSQ
jgi:proteasome lid subunit RPN8/RPN11